MRSHFAGTEQQLRKERQKRCVFRRENRQRWCGRDVARQIVPGAGSGDRKSSVANSRRANRQWYGQRRS